MALSLATHLKMKITFLQQRQHLNYHLMMIFMMSLINLNFMILIMQSKNLKVPSLPRKQGFANLDEVKNYKNVDLIPLQEHATFWYSNKTKWEKTREENVHQSGRLPAPNVLSKSSFETPLDGFSYFMPDTLLLFILENTNKKVQNFHDCFANNEDYFYKNKHCKLLDMVELKAFIRLLYLQASLKSTFPS